tara:strand:+ start:84 stop:320 length:237 start_codon:yes stop_codon:yes gene_type:complete
MKIRNQFYKILFVSIIFPPSAKAYAGPGVAIAAVLVFLTVVFAFFASFFIGIWKLLKKLLNKLSKFNKKLKRKTNNNK